MKKNREIVFIQSCTDDFYYKWQTHLWLESLKNIGKSDKSISLIFTPNFREQKLEEWKKLEKLYPESKFFYYKDIDNVSRYIGTYISIPRPYMLMKYWQLHPEMKDKAVFYCDADILFTERFNIDKYIDDDVCYLSDTKSYISDKYFDSKVKDVLPSKLEEYKKIDVLEGATKLAGISRGVAVKNSENSGGAQYLLKNIEASFWDRDITECIHIIRYLDSINKLYFENGNKGFQKFCSDMFSLLWGLWRDGKETKIIPEMDFAWSSDSISKLDKVGIFHNAGIVSELQGDIPVFYKGKYHQGKDPFKDPHLEYLSTNDKNKTLCNSYYVEKLIQLKEKYKL